MVPKGQRSNANEELELQGYGPDMYSIPLGPETGGGITHYMCLMPFDIPTYTVTDKVNTENGGEWVGGGQQGEANVVLAAMALRKFLRILKQKRSLIIKRA